MIITEKVSFESSYTFGALAISVHYPEFSWQKSQVKPAVSAQSIHNKIYQTPEFHKVTIKKLVILIK